MRSHRFSIAHDLRAGVSGCAEHSRHGAVWEEARKASTRVMGFAPIHTGS